MEQKKTLITKARYSETYMTIDLTPIEFSIIQKLLSWYRTNEYGESRINLHTKKNENGRKIKKVDLELGKREQYFDELS